MFWWSKFVYEPKKHGLEFVVKNKPLKSVEVRFYGNKHTATTRLHTTKGRATLICVYGHMLLLWLAKKICFLWEL